LFAGELIAEFIDESGRPGSILKEGGEVTGAADDDGATISIMHMIMRRPMRFV
jgi:hypothetical protein